MNKMLISVFTPVHKGSDFFNICIKGVCEQNYKNWEWIILDNSEHLNIEEYINEFIYATYDIDFANECIEKIKVYKHKLDNKNIGRLKDICCGLCNGELLLELDYDDYLMPDCLRMFADCCREFWFCDFFYSDWINMQWTDNYQYNTREGVYAIDSGVINYLGKQCDVKVFGLDKIDYNEFFDNTGTIPAQMPIHVRAWKKDFYHLIGGFDREMEIADDYDLIVKSYIYGNCCRISYPCCVVNYHNDNTTDKYERSVLDNYCNIVNQKYRELLQEKCKNDNGNFKIIRYIPTL